MDSSQRTKLIIGGVIILILAGAVVWMYSDTLFPGSDKPTPIATAPAPDPDAPAAAAPAHPPQVSGGKMLAPPKK